MACRVPTKRQVTWADHLSHNRDATGACVVCWRVRVAIFINSFIEKKNYFYYFIDSTILVNNSLSPRQGFVRNGSIL